MTQTTARNRILIIVTNHTDFQKPKAEPTGLWLSELVHFYDHFEGLAAMDIVSPSGGTIAIDPRSLRFPVYDKHSRRRHHDPAFMVLLQNTPSIHDVDWSQYDAVFFAGGHGAMWDFAENAALHALTVSHYERGGLLATVCHGAAVLPALRLRSGAPLIAGKRGTGFAYFDETVAGVRKLVPYNMQARLTEAGMTYSKAFLPLAKHVVVDGQLITGQNPNSTQAVAAALQDALRAR